MFETIKEFEEYIFSIETDEQLQNAKYGEADILAFYESLGDRARAQIYKDLSLKSGHEGCMAVNGETIAIVGSGLDIIHPKENTDLQKRILEAGGLILSEQLINTKASPTTLVARNRLQAALSGIVILAQCPAQSGSLHTMRFARQYHKMSLAVKYLRRTDANAGNFYLIESGLAETLVI